MRASSRSPMLDAMPLDAELRVSGSSPCPNPPSGFRRACSATRPDPRRDCDSSAAAQSCTARSTDAVATVDVSPPGTNAREPCQPCASNQLEEKGFRLIVLRMADRDAIGPEGIGGLLQKVVSDPAGCVFD